MYDTFTFQKGKLYDNFPSQWWITVLPAHKQVNVVRLWPSSSWAVYCSPSIILSKTAWCSGWKKNRTKPTKACCLIKCISTNTIDQSKSRGASCVNPRMAARTCLPLRVQQGGQLHREWKQCPASSARLSPCLGYGLLEPSKWAKHMFRGYTAWVPILTFPLTM